MYDEDFTDEKVSGAEVSEGAYAVDEGVLLGFGGPVVYCGPDMPKLGLKRFSVFYGGLTPAYNDAIGIIPEIVKLIAPYSELEEMRAKIAKAGTPEHEYYVRIEGAK